MKPLLLLFNLFVVLTILMSCKENKSIFNGLHPVVIDYTTGGVEVESTKPSVITYFYTDSRGNRLKYVLEAYIDGHKDTIVIEQPCELGEECKQGYYLYKRFFANNHIDINRQLPSVAINMFENDFLENLKIEYRKWYYAELSDVEARNIWMYLNGLGSDL
jgi:hypothetical protein